MHNSYNKYLHYQIVYLDETWVNAGHTKNHVWQDTTIKSSKQAFLNGLTTGLQAPTSKGEHLILLHVGNEAGFVHGELCLFRARKGVGITTMKWMVIVLKVGF